MSNITKSVRFASAAPQVVCFVAARSELTTEEMNNTWWPPAAMKEFFLSAKTLSKEAERSIFMVTGFEQAYETSAVLSPRDKTALQVTLEHVQVHQDLLDWCRFGHSWRGLERSSCVMHNDARTEAAKTAKNIVFELMKRNNVDAEVTRRFYERASRSSKNFARIMGEADALVSQQHQNPYNSDAARATANVEEDVVYFHYQELCPTHASTKSHVASCILNKKKIPVRVLCMFSHHAS